jgi:xanthine/CO dehydrogenase XdhC/CoxF family maturation factor
VVRVAVGWGFWFLGLFWLWMLLCGDWNRIEWIAGGCVAAVAATLAEAARRTSRVALVFPVGSFRGSASVLPMVFHDFALLLVALVRTSSAGRSTGRYVKRPIETGPKTTAGGAARRAWIVLLAGYSPDSYVVDIDVDAGEALLHDLLPSRRSERPA